jgi:hypothetical protein
MTLFFFILFLCTPSFTLWGIIQDNFCTIFTSTLALLCGILKLVSFILDSFDYDLYDNIVDKNEIQDILFKDDTVNLASSQNPNLNLQESSETSLSVPRNEAPKPFHYYYENRAISLRKP